MISHASDNPDIFSPYVAALRGLDEDEQYLMAFTFAALSPELRVILTGPSTLELLDHWVAEGLIPESHLEAVAKLIGLAALDSDVAPSSIGEILERIGITSEKAQMLAKNISELLQPIWLDRAASDLPNITETELPPLTQRIPEKPSAGPRNASRNIIDLRNQS